MLPSQNVSPLVPPRSPGGVGEGAGLVNGLMTNPKTMSEERRKVGGGRG